MSSSETRSQLLSQINSQIIANGTGAITGPVLNNILDSMVLSSIFNAGTWSAYVTYSVLDIVQYGGSSYIAILGSTNQVPPNATYWQVLAAQGPTGPTGPAGPSGGALVTVGTTTVNSGTNTYILYNNAGVLGNIAPSALAVGTATNVAGGAANQIPYQTGSGATSFVTAPSTSGTYLQWNGTAFVWAVQSGVTTFSGGSTGLTPNTATTGAITLGGVLGVSYGGTGVTTSTGSGSVVLSSFPTLVSPALGTPVSGVMSNVTGLPVSTGLAGTGTGVTTALGNNVNASGGFVTYNGALGTPTQGVLTNATGLPLSTGVTGNLSVNNLNSGTNANNATYWRGDGTWAAISSTAALVVGSSSVTSGTNGYILYNNAGTLGNLATTGSGNVVLATSPTLVTPALGTPSSVTLTNATGLPLSTGVSGLATGIATFLATPSSANLAAAITDETGTGLLVFGTSPTLVTPNLGTPTTLTLTNATGLPLSTGVTGNLLVTNLNSGIGASSTTYWRGDGTWASPTGSGTVNSGTAGQLTYYATTGTAVSGNPNATISSAGALTLGVAGTAAGSLLLSGSTSGTVTIETLAAAGSWTMTLPSTAGTNGYVLSTDGTGVTSWIATSGGGGTVTSVAQTFTGGLISVSGSPITGSGTLALTVAGTSGGIPYFSSSSAWTSSAVLTANALVVGGGAGGAPYTITTGSGVLTALTYTTNAANGIVVKDSNANVSVNSLFSGFTNVAAAGTTTVMTASSTPNFVVTGSGGQTYQLPDATTLPQGAVFTFNNNQTSGTVVVKNNSGTTLATVQSGGYVTLILLVNSTAAGSWDTHYDAPSNVSWSTNTFSYPGSITSATWNGTAIGAIYGGTGQTAVTTGDLLYGSATNTWSRLPATTNGYVLTLAGGVPTWAAASTGVTSFSAGSTGLTPNTATTGAVTLGGTLAVGYGGTGFASYTVGDILYASTTTALSKLADVATGSVLISGGVGVAPSYSSSPTLSGTLTAASIIANEAITGSLSVGAFSYGTLGYSDTNIFQSFTSSVNSYNQKIMQNTNSGSSASTNVIVSNNLGTASTYFGEFGMNSSGFSGTGAFNAANAVYLDATSADLVIGTTTSNAIHFVVNGNTTDAMTISSAGAVTLGTALAVGSGGSGATTLTGVLKGNGTSAFTAATAGTDYVAPGTATTFTATQTFNGSSSVLAKVLVNTAETTTVSATAATGTINFYTSSQSVLYYTTSASANWTLNVAHSTGTSLNTALSTGQTITIAFLVTNGTTAYYQSSFTIDGTAVTPKWQGGTAPSAGDASAVDIYTYTIVKTGSAAYTVFASVTKFA